MAKTKRCKICHKLFQVTDPSNPYTCSESCKSILVESLTAHTDKLGKCLWCGKSFIKANKNNKFCSKECRYQHTLSARRQQTAQKPVPEAPEKICKYCGKLFKDRTRAGKMLFCRSACRISYHSEKKKLDSTKPGVIEKKIAKQDKTKPRTIDLGYDEMREWTAARQARKRWTKIPLEEAAAICKEYNLSYPEYQYMRSQGTLQSYIDKHNREKEKGNDRDNSM